MEREQDAWILIEAVADKTTGEVTMDREEWTLIEAVAEREDEAVRDKVAEQMREMIWI